MIPTYENYCEVYGDKAIIPEAGFDIWMKSGISEINRYISAKVEDMNDIDAILCMVEVADILYENYTRRGITSETTDGYSVSYSGSENEIYRVIKRLMPKYLYRGVEL